MKPSCDVWRRPARAASTEEQMEQLANARGRQRRNEQKPSKRGEATAKEGAAVRG